VAKVRLLKHMASPFYRGHAGDVIDVTDELAEQLVDAESAEPVVEEEPEEEVVADEDE